MDELKEFNLHQRQNALDGALYEMFPQSRPQVEQPAMVTGPQIIEYFDNYVIIWLDDKYYKALLFVQRIKSHNLSPLRVERGQICVKLGG